MLMMNRYTSKILYYSDLGLIDYRKAWDLQKEIFAKRLKNEVSDTFFLLEHPNTYTLGKVTDKKNLTGSKDFLSKHKISVFEIDRGGDITYHGPGQIVGYSIIDLKNWKKDTHLYLRSLEEVIIKTCNSFGLKAGRKKGLTGVWIKERKICAIGIKINRWVTMHGFAFNVNTDLSLFKGIIPCGIKDKEVTSLAEELDKKFDIQEVKEVLKNNFIELFNYSSVEIKPKEYYL